MHNPNPKYLNEAHAFRTPIRLEGGLAPSFLTQGSLKYPPVKEASLRQDKKTVQTRRWELDPADSENTNLDNVIWHSEAEENDSKELSLVVIYDDFEASNRVLQLSRKLRQTFANDIDIKESWWKFSFLGEKSISQLAVQDAAEADVILFAFGSGYELPIEVAEFNKQWANLRRGEAGLLAALFHKPNYPILEAEVLEEYFTDLAAKTGLDYLASIASHPFGRFEKEPLGKHYSNRVIQPLVEEYFSPSNNE